MGVTEYLKIARRRWRILIVCALLGIIAGAGYTIMQDVTYTSRSQLYVSIQEQPGTNDAFQSVQAAQQRLVSYASLANGQAVTQAVVDQLNLDATPADVSGRITVEYPPGTVLLNITTTGSTADGAQDLNAAVDEQLQALIRRLETPPGGGNPAASLSVVDPPSEGSAIRADPKLYAGLGLIVGLGVGVIIAFLRDRSVRTIFSSDSVAAALHIPVIGPVDPQHPDDTRIRTVRTKVLAAHTESGAKTVFVTGTGVDSAPVTNTLVSTLVKTGRRTILVDARFGHESDENDGPGLGEVLAGKVDASEHLTGSEDSGLRILRPGGLDESAVNLIASSAFGEALTRLEALADIVVVQMGDLTASPEITSAAQHPAVVVIVIPLGAFEASAITSVAGGLIDTAVASVGVTVMNTVDPSSATGPAAATRGMRARLAGGKSPAAESAAGGRAAYPIVDAPPGTASTDDVYEPYRGGSADPTTDRFKQSDFDG